MDRQKQQSEKKKGSKNLLILLLLLGIVLMNLIPRFIDWEKAESLVQQKQFDEAIEIYERLKSNDMVRTTREQAAEYAIVQENYQAAAEYYRQLNLSTEDLWRKAGNHFVENQQYEEAVDAYANAGLDDKVKETRKAWAEKALSEGNVQTAIELFNLIGETQRAKECAVKEAKALLDGRQPEKLIQLLTPFAGEDIAQLMYIAVEMEDQGNHSPEIARKYGEAIRNLDTQLMYSNALMNNGYNLKAVYPEGVIVNTDLSQYHFMESEKADETSAMQKALVFARTQKKPALILIEANSVDEIDATVGDTIAASLANQNQYEVRLRLDLMMDLFETEQAWAMSDCTTIIMLEKGFTHSGTLTVRTRKKRSALDSSPWNSYSSSASELLRGYLSGDNSPVYTSSYRCYPYYSAYEAIVLYDKEHPERFMTYDGTLYSPIASTAVIGENSWELDGLEKSDVEEIQRALTDETSEESKKTFEKYDEKVIERIRKQDWGSYVLFQGKDANGEAINYKGSVDDVKEWNVEKYMIGQWSDSWMDEAIKEGALEAISIYMLVYDGAEE